MKRKVFLSIGTPCNPEQEKILKFVRNGLKRLGLEPLQPEFSYKAPLLNVRETLDQCDGIVVVAYPRYFIEQGKEKPGGDAEQVINNAYLSTSWNHIETAIAYDRGLPIMVLRDNDLKAEGFLEEAYDWKVQPVDFKTDFLMSNNFETMLKTFSDQVEDFKDGKYRRFPTQNATALQKQTIGNLISNMSLEAFLQLIALLAALLSTAFIAGMYFPQ